MTHFFSLDDKNIVITGGSSGIGKAVAERFAASCAKITIGDLSDCREFAESLGGAWLKTDVADKSSMQALMQHAFDLHGPIDVIINNAGVVGSFATIEQSVPRDYEFCHNVNTMGVVHGIQTGAPHMRDGGSIVNTASLGGLIGALGLNGYTASKFAVVGLTKTAALELADRKIRVNAVCPASVRTPMALKDGDQSQLEMEAVMIPLGRIAEADEVAATIHFLASDDASFINGQAIAVDGGMTAGTSSAAWEKIAGSLGD